VREGGREGYVSDQDAGVIDFFKLKHHPRRVKGGDGLCQKLVVPEGGREEGREGGRDE